MFEAWSFLSWLVTILAIVLTVIAIGHVLLHKRDSQSAVLWVLLCLLLPFFGPILYLFLGVNRSHTRIRTSAKTDPAAIMSAIENARFSLPLPGQPGSAQSRLGSAVTGLPLVSGNWVEPLKNGEQAYPAMLNAIKHASSWIYLAIYIFEHSGIGEKFISALVDAKKRGVDVYVLLDGVGVWYSLNRSAKKLAQAGVQVSTFLPPKLFPPQLEINLRNHRKILLVDGVRGFTGGMNIRQSHLLERVDQKTATRGMMFELQGLVLEQISLVFEDDWFFSCGESLSQKHCSTEPKGSMKCRTIVDGPDVHINTLINLLVGAFSMAEKRIAIVMPYFLPPPELIATLQAAALRGVDVVVLIPSRSNLRYVDWATQKILPVLISSGVKVLHQPPPFDHSKLLVIDNHYSLIGSSNFDARSLRLNFELVVEVYDSDFGLNLNGHIQELERNSERVTLEELKNKSIIHRIWYGFWWLFMPYL